MKQSATYWNGKGELQKEFDDLTDRLVPAQGEAETLIGESVRVINRIYSDINNNGADNLIDYPVDEGISQTDKGYLTERVEVWLHSIKPIETSRAVRRVLELIISHDARWWFNNDDGTLDQAVTDVAKWAMAKEAEKIET